MLLELQTKIQKEEKIIVNFDNKNASHITLSYIINFIKKLTKI